MLQIEYKKTAELIPYTNNARKHPQKQLHKLAASIKSFGFLVPVLIDDQHMILAGHGRVEAAKIAGLEEVPVISAAHLTEAQKRAFILADNRLAQDASWDLEKLKIELEFLNNFDLEMGLTGFETPEIDMMFGEERPKTDPLDDLETFPPDYIAVTREGDIWKLGPHRLICGNSLKAEIYRSLMGDERVQMVFTDPPYNVAIEGHVKRKTESGAREFVMASGEMSERQFTQFLREFLVNTAACLTAGAILYVCMDWRHIKEVHDAASGILEFKQLCVWAKDRAGTPPLGYDVKDKKLYIVPKEAETVRFIFQEYLASTSTLDLVRKLKDKGIKTKSWTSAKSGTRREGKPFNKGMLYQFLHCRTYVGEAVHKDKSWPGLHEAIVSKELFDKVQAKLATQNPKADCNRHPSQGILQGLVFDADGRAYSPVCHVRSGRRPYAYYVSQKAMREGYDTVDGIRSIRVEDVDKLVLKHIQNMLPKGWDHKRFKEKQAALRQCMEKVIICKDRIDLVLKTENGPETQSISVQLQKIGRKKVMMDSKGKDIVPTQGNKDPALIRALVRAHKWERILSADNKSSLRRIAETEDHEHRYVARIYQLNFLAPLIKEAILDGIQPRGLTLTKLKEGIPHSWQEQYRLYGF